MIYWSIFTSENDKHQTHIQRYGSKYCFGGA